MRLTNLHGLPEPLVRAVSADDYDRGDAFASISELAAPTRLAALRRLHEHEIVEDVADRLWPMFGTLIHALLSKHAGANVLHEERLFMDLGGRTVSGALDHYTLDDGGTLSDWKFTTKWSAVGKVKPEWEAQVNGYAMLLRAAGFPVKRAVLRLVLRDWAQKDPLKYGADFPKRGYAEREVTLWREPDASAYFMDKAAALSLALEGGPMAVCSPEERWAKEDAWAVMKPGRKTALKLWPSEAAAAVHAKDVPGGFTQPRPGESTRCLSYCPVSKWCDFGKALVPAAEGGEE